MSKPTLKVTADFTQKLKETVSRFKRDAVLVGIPEEKNERKNHEHFGNAAILAVNHFGSDHNHIPPRPVLEIGIRQAREEIAEQFKMAGREALSAGPDALERRYERAGFIASSSCKRVINEQIDIEAPAKSTLRARKYLTKSGFKGEKALLVTGQLRNAITFVVRSLWGR